MSTEGGQTAEKKRQMKKRRTLPVLPTYSHLNPSHDVPERRSFSTRQTSFSQLQTSSQSFSHRHRRYSEVNRSRRGGSVEREQGPEAQTPFFVGGLYKIPPYILRQLKEVEMDKKILPGHVEDIADTEISNKVRKKSNLALKSGRKVEIAVVEGSFRRIAGIREVIDDSGSFVIRTVEIKRIPGKTLGFFVRKGDGWFKEDGTFVSRINLGSLVETQGLLHVGEEILKVNGVDITSMLLENVAIIMQYVSKLVLTVKVLTSVSLNRTLSMRKQTKVLTTHTLPVPETESYNDINPYSEIDMGPTQKPVEKPAIQISPVEELKEENPYEVVGMSSSEPPALISSSTPVQLRAHKQTSEMSSSHECIRVISQIYDDRNGEGNAYEEVDFTTVPNPPPKSPMLTVTSPSQCEITWTSSESLDICPLNDFEAPNDVEIDSSQMAFREFSKEDLEPESEMKMYSGLLVNSMHNLQTSAVQSAGEVTCAISIDRLIKAKMPIPVATDVEEEKEPNTFHIDLFQNKKATFTLRKDKLSGSITIALAQLFPNPKAPAGTRKLYLAIEPFGKLKVELQYKPMSVAVKRMTLGSDSDISSTATFQDYAKFNPRNTNMPLVVEGCVEIIEEHGTKTPGIYRICTSESAKMEAFGASISQTKTKQDLTEIVGAISVHAFTGVLKDFFRTLPDPFFTNDFCSNLMQVAAMENQRKASGMMKSHIECLPEEVTTTLTFLLKHFRNVCNHSKVNGVTVDEISKIFGPLMLTPSHSSSSSEELYAQDYTAQAKVISILMLYV